MQAFCRIVRLSKHAEPISALQDLWYAEPGDFSPTLEDTSITLLAHRISSLSSLEIFHDITNSIRAVTSTLQIFVRSLDQNTSVACQARYPIIRDLKN